jgi:hypothetical protein
LKKYKRERVQVQLAPDFAIEGRNADNIVSGGSGPTLINPYIDLVNILDLTGLYKVLQWAKPRYEALAGFWDVGGEAGCADWWGSVRKGRRSDKIDIYIETALQALGDYAYASQYQPVWATTWAAFERVRHSEADSWMELLGVPLGAVPRWLAVLRYKARRAGTMACPTQLDSGWFGCFFPTPLRRANGLPLESGHPMHIGLASSSPLPPEFIHCQIKYDKHDFVACKPTSTISAPKLEDYRPRHHGAMVAEYGAVINAWMPSSW